MTWWLCADRSMVGLFIFTPLATIKLMEYPPLPPAMEYFFNEIVSYDETVRAVPANLFHRLVLACAEVQQETDGMSQEDIWVEFNTGAVYKGEGTELRTTRTPTGGSWLIFSSPGFEGQSRGSERGLEKARERRKQDHCSGLTF